MAEEIVTVIGAGAAGCAAALEAARLGLRVRLVDEHPQSLQAMSLDAPYFYGARLPGILDDSAIMAERVLGANEALLECAQAEIEIVTGTCAWGSFRPGPNNVSQQTAQIGLADQERSWLVEAEHLILATGARDLALSFDGWELPGVLGAMGAAALIDRYQAMAAERLVILGSGNLGLVTAKRAIAAGIEVAAILEAGPSILGDPELAKELAAAGVALMTERAPVRALGERSVGALRLVGLNEDGEAIARSEAEIACDTICLAMGAVANVELAALSQCQIAFDATRGGWAPVVDRDFRTSAKGVFAVGEAAGTDEAMIQDPSIAARQGRRAARAIARDLGLPAEETEDASDAPAWRSIAIASAERWLKALIAVGGMDVNVCQCEGVTRRELLDLSAPKYLEVANSRACGGVGALFAQGGASQDMVKRMTRAGMGHCQGKRCRDQVAMLLARATGSSLAEIAPGSYRPPVRPLPLSVMWAAEETEEMRRTWPIWLHPVDESAPGFAAAKDDSKNV